MRYLTHNTEMFQIAIDGIKAEAILEQISDAGFKMGKTSLRYLLNGERDHACGFTLTEEVEEAPVEASVVIKPMRSGSKMYQVAVELIAGATTKELCEKFGYSAGGVGATIRCKEVGIVSKGYEIISEKVEGRGTVMFLALAGRKIKTNEIVIK